MNAAVPPAFCAWAITCRARVVLPDDSGPKTSTTRPRGNPPIPNAASTEIEPDEITSTETTLRDPKRNTDPLPNCLSSCMRVRSMAFWRSLISITRRCELSGKDLTEILAGLYRHGWRGRRGARRLEWSNDPLCTHDLKGEVK